MFLGSLTENENAAFLALAKELISSDGEVSDQEKTLMRQLAIEMTCELPSKYFSMEKVDTGYNGAFDSLFETSMSREEAIGTFKSRRSKASALLELIGVAYCDTSYDPDEQEFIQEIGLAFGFTKEEVLAMENWVLRQIALVREAQEFFGAEVSV